MLMREVNGEREKGADEPAEAENMCLSRRSLPLSPAVRSAPPTDSTSRRVLWFSVMSIVVLVGLSVGQIVYLKKYFKGKKLI